MKEENKQIKAEKETLKEKKMETQKCLIKKRGKKSKYRSEQNIRKKLIRISNKEISVRTVYQWFMSLDSKTSSCWYYVPSFFTFSLYRSHIPDKANFRILFEYKVADTGR